MQATAKLRYARISPQKCRLVADVVRGKGVGNALATLKFMPKKGAELVLKVLESAIANAEHNLSTSSAPFFGMNFSVARALPTPLPQKGAELVLKVLESAIANAENNLGAD